MFRIPRQRTPDFEPEGPPRARSAPRRATRSGPSTGLLIGLGAAGGLVVLTIACVVLYFAFGRDKSGSNEVSPEKVALPSFPDLPPAKVHPASGAKIHFVDLGRVSSNGDGPGERMKMRVYLPAGDHAGKSLGCVLVAPAGTPLLYGNDMDNDDYHAETLPYVQAGYAVVFYSIDGPVSGQNPANAELAAAYKKFKAAQAGVVNGRNALEFVLAKLPAVDPQRIYSAGHSSAGVLSLLLAAHEPRIAGCIAYAPATNVELRLRDIANSPRYARLLPGVKDFLHETSPINQVDKYTCPLFLFHARDDRNEPFRTTENFVNRLREKGKEVTFATPFRGGHYQSMVREGIPRAIRWLKQQPGERGKTFPTGRPPTRTVPPRRSTRTFPGRRRFSTASGPLISFQVRSYNGRVPAQFAAMKALRRIGTLDPVTIRYDAAKKEISARSRISSISTGPMKAALEREGFSIGFTRVNSGR